jgi:hypothetical protein
MMVISTNCVDKITKDVYTGIHEEDNEAYEEDNKTYEETNET